MPRRQSTRFRMIPAALVCLAATRSAIAQQSEGLDEFRVLLNSDARLLVLGDSFSSWLSSFQRVFPAVLHVWPVSRWSAFAAPTDPNWGIVIETDILAGGNATNGPVRVFTGNNYQIETQTSSSTFFGLPIRPLQQLYMSPTMTLGPSGEFMVAEVPNDTFSAGANGRFTNTGDHLRYRFTYYTPTELSRQYADVTMADRGAPGSSVSFDLRSAARKMWHKGEVPDGTGVPARTGQINAIPQDVLVTANTGGVPGVVFLDGGNAPTSEGEYLIAASQILYHVDPVSGERIHGLYYSALADASWTYGGFGANSPSTGNKQFSLENLTHWLDVTTLDRDQPLRVFFYVDVEDKPKATVKPQMESMIDVVRAAAVSVGLDDARFCIVIPHFHIVSGAGGPMQSIARFEEQRDAAFEIALTNEDVAVASIFDATDQVLFDGSPEAVQWLVANGYSTLSYGQITRDLAGKTGEGGDLLDAQRLHPKNNAGAAFFAHILGRLIAESTSCAADCDQSTGPGMLDVFDFLCFQDRFIQGHPYACDCDTATGAAVCDIFDFLCFQDAFAAGCP